MCVCVCLSLSIYLYRLLPSISRMLSVISSRAPESSNHRALIYLSFYLSIYLCLSIAHRRLLRRCYPSSRAALLNLPITARSSVYLSIYLSVYLFLRRCYPSSRAARPSRPITARSSRCTCGSRRRWPRRRRPAECTSTTCAPPSASRIFSQVRFSSDPGLKVRHLRKTRSNPANPVELTGFDRG